MSEAWHCPCAGHFVPVDCGCERVFRTRNVSILLTLLRSSSQSADVEEKTGAVSGISQGLRKQWHEFREYFSDINHAKVLFATRTTWFLL
jgi:hypothetical protein